MKKLKSLKNYEFFFFFPPEQHCKNINWEKQAPWSFSSYHVNILTDSPLHLGHEYLSEPPTRKKEEKEEKEKKKKKQAGRKKEQDKYVLLQGEVSAAL